jgi:hypothetical protein
MKYSSFKFRFAHLYRKPPLLVVSGVLLLLVAAPSIRAQKKNQGGPRAIAVVTWNGDSPTPVPHASVLTPVAILVEGRFYDANLYEAQPEPITIDSGVVYDVLKNGDPIGTFTVGGAREKDDIWYGTGLFEPKGAMTVQMTKSGAKTTRSGQAAAAGKSNSDAPEDRPRLRRGTPPPPEPKAQTDAVLSTIDRDPERPTLRRHTADEIKAQQSAESAPPAAFVPPETHILPAVSDAGGPEPHSLIPHYKSGELLQIREDMEKLVRSELEKQRKQPEVPKKTTRQQHPHVSTAAPQLELTNAKFGVFDVNGNNAPIVIYSATTMLDATKKYITVGAWEEIDQSLRKVFSQITDDAHLDVYPRLEIIDAVDARGNGRGELLFRAFGDQGNRFVLYHPGPDSLDLLFDSAKGESTR